MTFIASVIAKKGVALIADSLVTTSSQVLEFESFYKYLQSKSGATEEEIKIDPKEVIGLFRSKPSHTKDFQEKLFRVDNFTGIATAGAAELNKKSLEEIIGEGIIKLNKIKGKRTAEDKLKVFEDAFKDESLGCLKKGNLVRESVLIFTQYNKVTHETMIHKIFVNKATPEDLKEEGFQAVTVTKLSDYSSVVCDGQNRLSEKILWGDIETALELIPNVAYKIFQDFKIAEGDIPKDYVANLTSDKKILPKSFYDDIKMVKLRELSLQQAIDLACLLMRIERDIQKYTENIPTVGGNVKIAIIDNKGFKFISGDSLTAGTF